MTDERLMRDKIHNYARPRVKLNDLGLGFQFSEKGQCSYKVLKCYGSLRILLIFMFTTKADKAWTDVNE